MSIFTLLGKLHKWFSPSDRSNDIEVKLSLVRLKSCVTYSLLGGLDITQALISAYAFGWIVGDISFAIAKKGL